MDILDQLQRLRDLGEQGEKRWYHYLFFYVLANKTVIDADTFHDAVEELERSLPDSLTTANVVARDKERIVREAQEERAKILEAAREQAQLLISNDELVRQAETQAEAIRREARIEADAIRAEAEAWARGVIERLENYITRTQGTLDKAKKALGQTASPGAPQRPEPRVLREQD